jgi:hypothetical protein
MWTFSLKNNNMNEFFGIETYPPSVQAGFYIVLILVLLGSVVTIVKGVKARRANKNGE